MTRAEARLVRWTAVPVLLLALLAVGQDRTSGPGSEPVRCVTVEERADCDRADARMDALMGEEVGR